MSGFGRILLAGVATAAAIGVVGVRAQSQLGDPKDAPRIFASTCSACHKSPQGLAKSGQVAGFLRQHYTTGPEMSAAMAAYLVAAGSGPAKKDKKDATASAETKTKGKKGEKNEQVQTAAHTQADRAADAKDRRTLRGKQLQQHAKGHEEPQPAHTPAIAAPAPPIAEPPPTRQAAAPAVLTPPAPVPAPVPAAPAPVTLDIPLPEMPTAPPADLTQSVFSSAPLP